MPEGATTENTGARPSADTSASIVSSSSPEKASGPTGWLWAISATCSRSYQIASHRARLSGSATGLDDASDQSTRPAPSIKKKTSTLLIGTPRLTRGG